MSALLKMQADSFGISDQSHKSLINFTNADRVNIVEGKYFYSLAGNTLFKTAWDSDFDISSKMFTIEGVIKTPALNPSTPQYFIGGTASSNYANGFLMGFDNRGFVFLTGAGTYNISNYLLTSVTANQPFHFAWVLNGTHKILYINGTEVLRDALTNGVSTPDALCFGFVNATNNTSTGGNVSDAGISQLEMSNGVKYSSNFTPVYQVYEPPVFYNTSIPGLVSISEPDDDYEIKGVVLEAGLQVSNYRAGPHRQPFSYYQ